MDILSALQLLNNAEGMQAISKGMQGAGQVISDQFDPIKQMIDDSRSKLADQMGMTKTVVDPSDASEYKVADQEAIKDRADNFADVASQMRPQFYDGPTLLQSGQAPTQAMGFPNPYTATNYGATQPPMSGNIGGTPTIDQILAALQARQ